MSRKKTILAQKLLPLRYLAGLILVKLLWGIAFVLHLPGKSFLRAQIELLDFCYDPLRRPKFYLTRYVEYPLGISAMASGLGETILDIGVGFSPVPIFLTYRDRNVISLDYSEKSIGVLKNLSQYETRDCKPLQCIVGDMRSIPVKARSIDKLFCISSIEHLPENGDFLTMTEIARVLKHGGRAFISFECNDQETEEWIFHHEPGGKEYWDAYEKKSNHKKVLSQTREPDEKREHLLFCRRYSIDAIQKRLLLDQSLKVVQSGIFTRPLRIRKFYDLHRKHAFIHFFDWLAPLIGILNMVFQQQPFSKARHLGNGSFGYVLVEKT